MAILYAFYFAIAFVNPRGMGFGDVKLAGVIGLCLGWLGWGIFRHRRAPGGFLLGAAVGPAPAGRGRRGQHEVEGAVGPFMLAGALLAIVAGSGWWSTYLGTPGSAAPSGDGGAAGRERFAATLPRRPATEPNSPLTTPGLGVAAALHPHGAAAWGQGAVVAGRTAIGLDIGTSGVRAAELSFGKDSMTLEKFGQVALAEGVVRDGEVVDVDGLATAIRQLWSYTHFSSKRVVIGVSNSKVIVRQVDLPWLPADELSTALPYQVQDFIPIPVDQAVLDFLTLEEITGEGGARLLRGLLVAASRDMVMNAVTAVQQAGLTPTMVDLTSFAVLRSLARPTPLAAAEEVEAVVDVGARITNIVVHVGGVPRFVRILLMGGEDITEAVAERVGVPHAQAEALKQQHGLVGDRADDITARVLENAGLAFVDEVRGSLDYYTASSGSAPISRIVLSGGGGRLLGLVDRLTEATRLPVVAGAPIAPLVIGKTGLTPEQIQYVGPLAAVPVGLALGAAS